MNNLVPVNEIQLMANAVAKSGLFGIKTPEQAMALMLIAQAEGLHPAIAARDYHVIQGRPALKADAMLARFQKAGGSVEWHTYCETEVSGTFSHPQGGSVRVTWTMDKAAKIKCKEDDKWITLREKKVYREYPAPMLRSRCISEGVRTVYPGVVVGAYTPEEVEEEIDQPAPIKDMGAADVVDEPIQQPKATSEPKGETKAPSNPTPIGEGPKRIIRAKLTAAGITDVELCKKFGVESLDALTMDKVNAAIAWIANPGD